MLHRDPNSPILCEWESEADQSSNVLHLSICNIMVPETFLEQEELLRSASSLKGDTETSTSSRRQKDNLDINGTNILDV
ncbi:hypothetical protein RB195_013806 [Necator americanus]|uniref:Uncharacterized protein n=1 Tax=Necator americanus TaxID=51031 RepID=A0ABR1DXC5_NECAM